MIVFRIVLDWWFRGNDEAESLVLPLSITRKLKKCLFFIFIFLKIIFVFVFVFFFWNHNPKQVEYPALSPFQITIYQYCNHPPPAESPILYCQHIASTASLRRGRGTEADTALQPHRKVVHLVFSFYSFSLSFNPNNEKKRCQRRCTLLCARQQG
jgi:hypothetical protein